MQAVVSEQVLDNRDRLQEVDRLTILPDGLRLEPMLFIARLSRLVEFFQIPLIKRDLHLSFARLICGQRYLLRLLRPRGFLAAGTTLREALLVGGVDAGCEGGETFGQGLELRTRGLGIGFETMRRIDKAIEQWEIIYKKNHAFRDVAAKLEKYKDVRTNDVLKDYLTCPSGDFTALCEKLAQNALSFTVRRSDAAKWGCQIIASDRGGDWMNGRKQSYLLRFYRTSEALEDSVVRQALDDLKGANCSRAYIFSSSDFSRSARAFSENRQVELIGKEQLEQALKKSGIQ